MDIEGILKGFAVKSSEDRPLRKIYRIEPRVCQSLCNPFWTLSLNNTMPLLKYLCSIFRDYVGPLRS